MPKCKNDEGTSYTGKEPSPKGKGYAAHACDVGTIKTGTDGKKWEVRADSNGSHRWFHVSASDSTATKKKSPPKKTYSTKRTKQRKSTSTSPSKKSKSKPRETHIHVVVSK